MPSSLSSTEWTFFFIETEYNGPDERRQWTDCELHFFFRRRAKLQSQTASESVTFCPSSVWKTFIHWNVVWPLRCTQYCFCWNFLCYRQMIVHYFILLTMFSPSLSNCCQHLLSLAVVCGPMFFRKTSIMCVFVCVYEKMFWSALFASCFCCGICGILEHVLTDCVIFRGKKQNRTNFEKKFLMNANFCHQIAFWNHGISVRFLISHRKSAIYHVQLFFCAHSWSTFATFSKQNGK